MAQHDYSIANQGFPATRADINNVLSAIATNNSGTSAPSTQYAGQFWIDTTSSTWTLYIHDGADDIQFATIDTSANTVNFIDSELGDNSVTTAKIADGNVTSAKLSYPLTTFSSTGIDDNATSTAITIDSSQNVGIGTTPSIYELEVKDASGVAVIRVNNGGDSRIVDLIADSTGGLLRTVASYPLVLNTNQTERMRITSTGKVGIGTSSPTTELRVIGQITSESNTNQNGAVINCVGTPANYHFDVRNDNAAIFRVDPSGNVGINLTNPGEKLDVAGNISGNNVLPRADNIYSLGSTSKRYNDLFLGDGLFLGGTGTANKLDDYEEGTFTATLKGGSTEPGTLITTTGYYTKIGRLLKFQLGFEDVDTTGYSGGITVIGLPFANFTGARSMVNAAVFNLGTFSSSNYVMGAISLNDTLIGVQQLTSNGTWSSVTHNVTPDGYLWITGTYTTA